MVKKSNAFLSLYYGAIELRADSGEADCGGELPQGENAMLVDVELRERLSDYCTVTKQTQERAANVAMREMLERCEADPLMKERMNKAKMLKEALASL